MKLPSLQLFVCISMMIPLGSVIAQGNEKGTVHIDLGANGAFQDTQFERTYEVNGVTFRSQDSDGSMAFTVPIALRLGVFRPLSIGAYVEPGSYLDSNATRSNALFKLGLQPRIYLVNRQNFSFFADGQLGGTFLRIRDISELEEEDSRYRGSHFGAGAGFGIYFGSVVGMNFRLGYITTENRLRSYAQEGDPLKWENVEADLRTTGVELSAGFTFRL